MTLYFSPLSSIWTDFADRKAKILDLNLSCQNSSKKKTSSSKELNPFFHSDPEVSLLERKTVRMEAGAEGWREEETHFSNFLWKLAKGTWISILNRSKRPYPTTQQCSSILISLLHLDFCVSNYDKDFFKSQLNVL